MAKKTNKTDHVLNLLSTGSKKGDTGKNDKEAAPVQLRRPGGDDTPREEQNQQQDLPDLPDLPDEKQEETRPSAPDLPDLPDVPEVSVVHTEGEENPIADAVKESLEAELETYLEADEAVKEQLQDSEPKEDADLPDLPDIKDDSDLPDLPDVSDSSKESDAPAAPDLPDLPDLPDVPENPDLPDLPDTSAPPEIPDTPDLPDLPDTHPQDGQPQEAGSQPDEPVSDADSPQSEELPVAESSSESAPAQESKAPEESADETESGLGTDEELAAAEEAGPADEAKPDYATLNVMEQLVKAQVPQYVKQFGHCDCDRCVADVVALTLTHLPAKYVVVNQSAISPLMNFYEKRYAGQIVVEITKAAMVVREFPHHSRKD